MLAERRGRAVTVSIGLAAVAVVALGVVPLPSRTLAEGVVWPPEGAEVRAGADGFVVRLLARPDQSVSPGDPLVLVSDPTLDAEVALLVARRREMVARYTAERVANPVDAQIASVELASADSALARARERADAALVRSGARGALVLPAGENLIGRFVRRGELLGYVVGEAASSVRVALAHANVAQVRDQTRRVEVRLSRGLDRALPASIARIVPAATSGCRALRSEAAAGVRLPSIPRTRRARMRSSRCSWSISAWHPARRCPSSADARMCASSTRPSPLSCRAGARYAGSS